MFRKVLGGTIGTAVAGNLAFYAWARNVMGEDAVGFAVLEWNQETKDFKEVARNQILKPMSNWTGADINVNKEGQ